MSRIKDNMEQFFNGYDGEDDEYFYRKSQEAEYRQMTEEKLSFIERAKLENEKIKEAIKASIKPTKQ